MILHTEIVGDGETIVFLHTGLQTGLTDFESQRNYFSQNYQVIVPDLRGHGKSSHDDVSNFYYDSANDLLETFTYLNIESAHIVGCSLGAVVGLLFAKTNPQKVKTLTLSGLTAEKPSNWAELHQESVKHQSELVRNDEIVTYFNQLHGEGWQRFIEMGKDENFYPFDETRDLTNLQMTTLFMVGEGLESERIGAILYPKLNKNVHVSIIPFASHLVHTEQPELYTNVLEAFLDSNMKTG
ncbi:alpha/beta hydrolase [Bacillus carboniphilus]|uniref:Alpha/beta hydrolase n=1 Tax=Bacillus carboniphilus TaxID=86663 RepID=A0ABY9JVA2_9BACI|nr:alpha/beta hydrolase [Bacillus carboniphilus]WLR41611.1 alpha/beta hydrolase [Bacillus carboniphilus]